MVRVYRFEAELLRTLSDWFGALDNVYDNVELLYKPAGQNVNFASSKTRFHNK